MFHVKRSREGEDVSRETKEVAFRSPAGACLLCRLPTLPLVCFSAPIPPTPFPRGEGGEIFGLFCRGLAPPAPLRLSPDGIGFFCRVSAFCPHPPDPRSQSALPGGKGDFWFSYARGSAPCIPGAKPGRHWLFSAMSVLSCPHPPDPLPGGKGETKVILCKGLRPLHPRG